MGPPAGAGRKQVDLGESSQTDITGPGRERFAIEVQVRDAGKLRFRWSTG
jgi:hypothetical protein